MVEWTKALTIETSNWVIAISFIVATAWVAFRAKVNRLSFYDRSLVKAAGITITGVAINAGWFAASRHLAPDGQRWNSLMFEYRAYMVAATAAMILYGIARFMFLIEGYSPIVALVFVLIVVSLSLLMGVY